MKKLLPFLLTCIISIGTVSPGGSTTQDNLLTEIRDALTDDYTPGEVPTFPITWGYANTLSGLDPNQADSTGLATYWSGQNVYSKDTLSRMEFSQIIIDIIVTRGVLTSAPSASNSVYRTAYTTITGSSLPSNDPIITDIKNISESQTQLPIALTNLLARAFELKARADSCSAYWGDPSSGTSPSPSTPTVPSTPSPTGVTTPTITPPPSTTPVTRLTTATQISPTTAPSFSSTNPCSCAKCSVAGSSNPYNGYAGIIAETRQLKTDLQAICGVSTTTGFTGGDSNFNSKPACRFIRVQLARDLLAVPSGTPSESQGKSFIETLSSNVNSLLTPIQTLILMRIDNALSSTGRYPTTSFSSIYTQPASVTTCPTTISPSDRDRYAAMGCYSRCSGSRDSAPTPGVLTSPGGSTTPATIGRCMFGSSSIPALPTNESLDIYIDNLVGMNSISPPIVAGIPMSIIGLTPTNRVVHPSLTGLIGGSGLSTSLTPLNIYIAGIKLELERVAIGSNHYYKTTAPRSNQYLFISDEEGSDAKSIRDTIQTAFYSKRQGYQSTVSKSLMAKSSALDIISEIRRMNSVDQHYQVGSNVYSKTPMQILEESSQWRLKPGTDSWLDQVADMSNVSLLREIAVLLAEARQMQYLQLQASQKQLLIQAITSTSAAKTDGDQVEKLNTEVSNFASGLNPNPEGGSSPPGSIPTP